MVKSRCACVSWCCKKPQRERFDFPVVYNVSNEYAMVQAAAKLFELDRRKKVVSKNLIAMKRAGADIMKLHAPRTWCRKVDWRILQVRIGKNEYLKFGKVYAPSSKFYAGGVKQPCSCVPCDLAERRCLSTTGFKNLWCRRQRIHRLYLLMGPEYSRTH